LKPRGVKAEALTPLFIRRKLAYEYRDGIRKRKNMGY
jgi:hypothetical protein